MTGWTWEQVEDLRMPDLAALLAWWKRNPPMAYAMAEGDKAGGSTPGEPGGEKRLSDDELVNLLG